MSEWWEDQDIKILIDDLLRDVETHLKVIMPLLLVHKENTDEWKVGIGLAAFVNQYDRARQMDFTIDEALAYAINYIMQLPYIQQLMMKFVKDGIDMIGGQ